MFLLYSWDENALINLLLTLGTSYLACPTLPIIYCCVSIHVRQSGLCCIPPSAAAFVIRVVECLILLGLSCSKMI